MRERFLSTGLRGFAEHEVVELLLTLCQPRRDVKPAAKALLERFGSLKGILDAPSAQLQGVDGIGEVTPVALRIVKAMVTLYLEQTAEAAPQLDSVDALIDLFRARLGELRHEVFEVAYLDKRYALLKRGVERLSEGLPDRTSIHPRQIMRAALDRHAVHVVVAHNHPSGNLEPSSEDIRLTTAIQTAGQAVGVVLLDHIIVTPDSALSFLDRGLLRH